MSNILNLKGVKFFAIIVLAVAILATLGMVATTASAQQATVSASDIQYAATVQSGSSGEASLIWQKFLNNYSSANLVADGKFGPLSAAAAKIWQASRNLSADGVLGAMSRASAISQINAGVTNPIGASYPIGCSSNSGFSVTTGLSCASAYPAGCTSTAGFSVTTGLSCAGTPNNVTLPAGCTSTMGYSSTTGTKCDSVVTPPVTPPTTPSGPLAGTAGTLSDVNTLSQYSAEEVGAGQKDVKILGFEAVASKDGDIGLSSLKVTFSSSGNASTDSDRLVDYLASVSVWMEGTKVATVDTDDFTKDSTGVYSKTVPLTDVVIRAGKTVKFYVSVDAVGNLDSGDIDSDSWTITLDNIRYVDGGGVTTTDTTTGTLPITDTTIAFVSFSAASDTELKISTNSTPDAGVVKVSTANDTNSVTLLKGKFVLDGTSTAWVDEIPVTLTSTGDSIDALASSVTLTLGDKTYTETLGANCTSTCASNTTAVVTFDNLDYTIAAGATVNFTVKADINDIENTGVTATDFDEGDTLLASLLTTNRDDIVVENDQGDSLTDATERTGSATGNAQSFYSTGIQVALVSVVRTTEPLALTVENTSQSSASTFTFDVTAFGADIYVDGTVTEDGDGTYADGTGVNYYITRADTGADGASLTTPSASLTTGTGSGITTAVSSDNTTWKVVDGTKARFVLQVDVTNTFVDGSGDDALPFQTFIKSIGWDTTAIAATTNEYTFNLDAFKNVPVTLHELDAV